MLRINKDAENDNEVIQYFKTRNLQLSQNNLRWDNILYKSKLGYVVNFHDKSGTAYSSFYVLKKNRGKGYSKQLVDEINNTICTINDCEVISFLQNQNKDFKVFNGIYDTVEYKTVEKFYGDGKAQRSKVFFMNHIDEGVTILTQLNKSTKAKTAFCLHPLVQDDGNLANNFSFLSEMIDPYTLGLALEYRNIANAYLSKRHIESLEEIKLSPLPEVNDMLIADKIQNYKDFLIYHKDTHPRSKELEHYFNNWLEKLNCKEEFINYVNFSKFFEEEVKIINI